MANLALIFPITPTSIDVIDVDAAVSQMHESASEITEHPVERGNSVSDHSRPKPDRLTIEGIVTNTPINLVQRRRVVSSQGATIQAVVGTPIDGAEGRAEAAERKLRDLKEKGTLVTVVTRLRTYRNMMIESLQFPQDAHTGDALRFTAQLKAIVIVQNKVTPVTVRKERAKKQKLHKQETKPSVAEGEKADRGVFQAFRKGGLDAAGDQVGTNVSRLFGGL